MEAFTQQERDEGMDQYWTDSGKLVDAILQINYVSGSGETTKRKIHVTHFDDSSIRAHCDLRREVRTFLIDRIASCVDFLSERRVDDVYDHLFGLYEQTPEYSYRRTVNDHLDHLRAILYIIEFSGYSESQQVGIIRNLCRRLANDNRISAAMVSKLFVQYRQASLLSYKQAVGRLSKKLSEQDKAALLKLATRMATTIEETNKFSQEALDYMSKRFDIAAP